MEMIFADTLKMVNIIIIVIGVHIYYGSSFQSGLLLLYGIPTF